MALEISTFQIHEQFKEPFLSREKKGIIMSKQHFLFGQKVRLETLSNEFIAQAVCGGTAPVMICENVARRGYQTHISEKELAAFAATDGFKSFDHLKDFVTIQFGQLPFNGIYHFFYCLPNED